MRRVAKDGANMARLRRFRPCAQGTTILHRGESFRQTTPLLDDLVETLDDLFDDPRRPLTSPQ
ncbi:hypothetical protein ABZ619_23625 [Streptomyces sp. NPDC007851]|uniref:hypothetical protein n=1 Tax=Streptomyces sp. NPDC007851 TaxID=3155008 RepID=UPI0033CBC430